MIPNKAYAISDFIQSALKNRSINIQANHDVFRKYVDAGQFMDILIQLAQRKNNTVLNSGGYLAEIGEVAKLVSEKIGLTSILRPAYNGSPASNYFSNDNTFNLTAKKLGVHLLSLGEQIDLTLLGHREQLG
jgi:nucleoside-diphosphate-sugar epimerase